MVCICTHPNGTHPGVLECFDRIRRLDPQELEHSGYAAQTCTNLDLPSFDHGFPPSSHCRFFHTLV